MRRQSSIALRSSRLGDNTMTNSGKQGKFNNQYLRLSGQFGSNWWSQSIMFATTYNSRAIAPMLRPSAVYLSTPVSRPPILRCRSPRVLTHRGSCECNDSHEVRRKEGPRLRRPWHGGVYHDGIVRESVPVHTRRSCLGIAPLTDLPACRNVVPSGISSRHHGGRTPPSTGLDKHICGSADPAGGSGWPEDGPRRRDHAAAPDWRR